MAELDTVLALIQEAERRNGTISDVVLEYQARQSGQPPEALLARMGENLAVMKRSAIDGRSDEKSASGLSGGMARRYEQSPNSGRLLSGLAKEAIAAALAISEHNACMGRVVAAPTAGSCGILPAVLIASQREYGLADEALVRALFNAAGVGMVIARRASISGAQGGCQAECGSAAALAASALVELLGGAPEQCGHACALALKFSMGLTCDPVAGLVEVPCVKRNASGAVSALTAAELALAGIESAIPVDEVIDAMKQVGDLMSVSLKETSLAGLAATRTGLAIQERMNQLNPSTKSK